MFQMNQNREFNLIPIPAPTDNVLFGAAAIAAIGATMAIVLDDQRKRQQLLDEENAEAKEEAAHLQAQEDAYLVGQAAQAKAQAKYQAALYGQYVAEQQELDAEASQAAARNTLPSDVMAIMSGSIYDDPETDDTETKDTEANVAQAFREADDASMATVATAAPVAAANTQVKATDQNEPWWDQAIDFVDHNQVAASAVIGLGVGLGAVAIIATGGLATPLVIGGAALIAAGLTVGGTVALNAHYDRPPDENLIRNVGVAATAAIVAGVAPEFYAVGQAAVATAVTNASMVAYASGASLAGAALAAAAPVAGAAASLWALGSVGAIGYGLSTSADPTLSPEENQMGSVIGAEGTQSLEAVTDISNLADMANELSPFNQIVTEYADTDPAKALGTWNSTNLKSNGVALALRSGSDVVRVYDQILHHHIFTALRLRIRWQFRPIHIHHFFPVDMDLSLLAALHMPLAFVPLLLRRMVAGWRLGLVPLGLRFPLFPFQTVDFIPIALHLRPGIPQIPTQLLHDVQQPLDQLSSVLLMDRIQVKVFEHGGVSLLAYLQTGKRSFFPTLSPAY